MQKNYFQRYIWLLDLLQTYGRLTLNEIQKLWMDSQLNHEHEAMPIRTFHHNRTAISNMFGIDVVCDRHTNEYYIDKSEILNADGVKKWLLDAMSLNNLITESQPMEHRVAFEKIFTNRKSMVQIIRGLRANVVIEMDYQYIDSPEQEHVRVEPWCIKLFKQRWYMVGLPLGQKVNIPSFYMIECTQNVELTQDPVTHLPKNFDARAFLSDYFGVCDSSSEPKNVTVKLRTSKMLSRLLEISPLHHTQHCVPEESDENYVVYTYNLIPNIDLIQELLTYCDHVEVLEPLDLRKRIREDILRMMKNYQD